MSLTDGDVSSVKEEFAYNGSCPYCHSLSIKMTLVDGSYSEKEAKEHDYWRKRECKCDQCDKEWYGMDYYHVKTMKKLNLIKAIIASFVIGVMGAVAGGSFSYELQFLVDYTVESEDPGFAVPGIISGFLLCFLGSMWFLSWMRSHGDKANHWVGLLFGAGAGALTASLSMILNALLYLSPGWHFGENVDWNNILSGVFLFGIPGAFLGLIAALFITLCVKSFTSFLD